MQEDNCKEAYLHPAQLYADRASSKVTTVLGSCVAVCFWDRHLKIGGINHYMLPLWNGEGLPSPRYGNIAIPKLLEKLYSFGCRKDSLIAKIFGGGAVLQGGSGLMSIGERNISIALEMLGMENIPIVSSNTGDIYGRKLIYYTATGEVLMKKFLTGTNKGE